MKPTETNPIINDAIKANIGALAEKLAEASALASEAYAAIIDSNRNQAIGTIIGLDDLLSTAQALQGAALALHRTN